MTEPLISVIIPCYKVEKYLDRCMESVVNQSYRNLEIILVDDGSPDKSGQICDAWQRRDSRIKVIHKPNGGLGFARNSGLEIATGQYVAFIDSDDFVSTDMYATLLKYAQADGSDIVYCGYTHQLGPDSEKIVSDFSRHKIFESRQLKELSQGFFRPTDYNPNMLIMSVWHALYRRDIITQPFYSEREVCSEDVHFQASAMLAAKRVSFIPDPLITYCYNAESLSNTFNTTKFKRYLRLRELINELYTPHGYPTAGDYLPFMIALITLRDVTTSTLPIAEQKAYIRQVVKDPIWASLAIPSAHLNLSKRLFLAALRTHSPRLLTLLSRLYSRLH